MRIHRIEMTGFGPFRQTQVVDFEAFDDHGIFLITGRTGAGKSSILDAIVYALYDSAPRYGGGSARRVRSDHCTPDEPTRVELVFSAGGQTYRIVRQPEYVRPKSRGEGLTTEKAKAELCRLDGGQWVGVASQLRVVGEELHQILPLSCDQFLQVVLLAQGQFQRFLVASSDERQRLLRTLFRSDRFTEYDAVMQRRAAALRKELQIAESGIEATIERLVEHSGGPAPETANEEWLTGLLDAHQTDVEVAQADLEQADKELRAAQDVLQQATELAARQHRFTAASAELGRLLAEVDAIEQDRTRRDRAVAAQSVAVAHTSLRSAATRARDADAELGAALTRFTDVVGTHPPEDLPAHADRLTSELALLQARLADEQRLERLRAGAESLREQLASVTERLERLTQECEQQQSVVDAPIETSSEQARHALDLLRDEVAQATRRVRAEEELATAQREELRCGRDRTAASAALDALQERRLANYAGTLAAELREGEPCAVCGGVEHPAPAGLAAEPVTEEMLDEARTALDEASSCARAASDRVVALRTTVDGLAAVRPLADLETAVQQAQQRLEQAQQAEAARTRAQSACERLTAERQDLEVRQVTLQQGIEHATAQVAELAAGVEQARGAAGSVVERIEIVTGHIAATSDLIAARAAAANAQDQLGEAAQSFDEMLAHHGFDDEEAFSAARLQDGALRDLTARIAAHDRARAGAEAALAAPELQDLPTEPADVEGPRAAHAEAEKVCDAAKEHVGAVRKVAEMTGRLAAAIRRGWEGSARARAEFEVLDRLAKSLHGEPPNTRRMRLESYVLAAELDQIVAAANVRLHEMSSGRYALRRSEDVATRGTNAGLEVQVMDEYTSQARTPESLSGGEKFLASLALALGLAEVVTSRAGGITLDTLFIDEGFGSLDAETLDVAMHTLDSLRENGRTIGLISHVETMKERIPAQLSVVRTPAGCSAVESRV